MTKMTRGGAPRYTVWLVAALCMVALAAGVAAALPDDAQAEGQATFGQMPGGMGGPGGQGGMGGPGMMGPGGPGGGSGAAIAVAEGKVFVVQGRTLYRFDAGTLELDGSVEIPAGEGGMAGPGGPPPVQ